MIFPSGARPLVPTSCEDLTHWQPHAGAGILLTRIKTPGCTPATTTGCGPLSYSLDSMPSSWTGIHIYGYIHQNMLVPTWMIQLSNQVEQLRVKNVWRAAGSSEVLYKHCYHRPFLLLIFCHFLAWIYWIASAPALHCHDPTQYSYTALKVALHGGRVPATGM